jgi:phosphopantothenoylcysteine decarboxylase/phosphopantothenate--cysteine ligase
MLSGKKILVGVSGSIASYKSALLVRLLIKSGAEVQVVMTPAAAQFISPLTLGTLSRKPAIVSLFEGSQWSDHVRLGRWADCMIIAPLTCNTLSKMASGACDNMLMAVYLSATCPVLVAPAMDEDMWKHPSTIANLIKIRSFGNVVIPVDNGELASGLFGEGRMAEPEKIVTDLLQLLTPKDDLKGRSAIVTAGPTYESIDPVRFVGNHSSGKMGIALARSLQSHGAEVHLILGPVSDVPPLPGIDVRHVRSADEMYEESLSLFPTSDIAVMAAAVADYKPVVRAPDKIKKKEEDWTLRFTRTPDILKTLGSIKKPGQYLVGFALETDQGHGYAKEKLQSKNADMIVLNSLQDAGAGFGHNTNKVTIFDRMGGIHPFELKSKDAVAEDIVRLIISNTHE